MGNSFTSVIESSESSLYNADERRSSSRLGILPLSPLVDDGEDHPLTSSNADVFSDHHTSRRSTVVRIVTNDSDSEDKALMPTSSHHPTYPGQSSMIFQAQWDQVSRRHFEKSTNSVIKCLKTIRCLYSITSFVYSM